ncbi:MAG: non-canonical purine NTP pyrophosphatase, partial [Thaumarchaeota archaeon]|nr:non-canonical purine NTP pyrophosphatase [Nitrososphaerota archaeon]
LSKNGINLGFFKNSLREIQAESIKEIAALKVDEAYRQCHKPVIVEDAGLFVESLNGFPGPFSSYVFKTIGNLGILRLVKTNRKAKFQSVVAYCDNKYGVVLFDAKVEGKISKNSKGKGWGYDPIFIPNGQNKTYAMLSNKNEISHRYKALTKFSNWFVRR